MSAVGCAKKNCIATDGFLVQVWEAFTQADLLSATFPQQSQNLCGFGNFTDIHSLATDLIIVSQNVQWHLNLFPANIVQTIETHPHQTGRISYPSERDKVSVEWGSPLLALDETPTD